VKRTWNYLFGPERFGLQDVALFWRILIYGWVYAWGIGVGLGICYAVAYIAYLIASDLT
jgi:hypothetical protein